MRQSVLQGPKKRQGRTWRFLSTSMQRLNLLHSLMEPSVLQSTKDHWMLQNSTLRETRGHSMLQGSKKRLPSTWRFVSTGMQQRKRKTTGLQMHT